MSEETIKKVINKVKEFHPLESEFQEVIDENFDDMLCLKDPSEEKLKLKDPLVFTSYYSSPYLRQLRNKVTKISISIHPPKGWIEKGGLHYLPLCPSEKIFWDVKTSGDKKTYAKELLEQLNQLNPYKVMGDLMDMSNGKPITLLCFEFPRPTVGEIFCHRTVVGQWLSSNLGIIVPELTENLVQDLLKNDEESLF